YLDVIFTMKQLFFTKALSQLAIIGAIFFIYILLNSLAQAGFNATVEYYDTEYSKLILLPLSPILLKGRTENRLLIYFLTSGTFFAIVFGIFYSVINIIPLNREIFASVFDIHHTYLSLFILLIMNKCILKLFSAKLPKEKTVLLLLITLLGVYVMYSIESKTSMVIIVLLLCIHLFPQITPRNIPKVLFVILFSIIILYAFNNKLRV